MRSIPLVLAVFAALPCAAQTDTPDERSLASFREYLEQRPHDEQAFESLYRLAVEGGVLPDLLAEVAADAEGEEATAARVLRARLLVRLGSTREAAGIVALIKDKDAATWHLTGDIALASGASEDALDAFDNSLHRALDEALEGASFGQRELEELYERRADALLALGRTDEAVGAYGAVVALDPASFTLRLSVGRSLAAHGLFEAAREHLEAAVELAGDPEREVRALFELGGLEERSGELDSAVERYRRARARIGRGHWLEDELVDRELGIHRRSGRLEELRDHARAALESAPDDLAAAETYARVLREMGELEAAAEVLASASAKHPEDGELSARLRELYGLLGDTDALLDEYARMLTRNPDDVELHLAHGEALADAGDQRLALYAWERAVARDPSVAWRITEACWARGWKTEALERLRVLLAGDPTDDNARANLVRWLVELDRVDEAEAALGAAYERARGDWRALEALASLWAELGQLVEARDLWIEALELEPDQARVAEALASAHIALGEFERALRIELDLLAALTDPGRLAGMCEHIVAQHDEMQPLEDFEAALERGTEPDEATAVLLRAEVLRRSGQSVQGRVLLEALAGPSPHGTAARLALARSYRQDRQWRDARDVLEHLVRDDAPRRREHLSSLASAKSALGDQLGAAGCYEEILALAPDNVEAVARVATAFDALGRSERAIECLERAARLAPEELSHPLRLAEWERKAGDHDAALDRIVAILGKFPGRELEVARRYRSWSAAPAARARVALSSVATRSVARAPQALRPQVVSPSTPVAGVTVSGAVSVTRSGGRVNYRQFSGSSTSISLPPRSSWRTGAAERSVERSRLEARRASAPHEAAPAYLLAFIALRELDYDAAGSILDEACALHPRHAGLSELAERVLLRRGELADAWRLRAERLRTSGSEGEGRDLLTAEVALRRGDRQSAERLLERVSDPLPRAALLTAYREPLLALELLLEAANDPQADELLLETAAAAHEMLSRYEETVPLRRRVAETNGQWRAWWCLDHAASHAGSIADSTMARQQVFGALRFDSMLYDEVTRLYRGMLDCPIETHELTLSFLADCHMQCERWDDASAVLSESVAQGGGDAMRHQEAAEKWNRFGKPDNAELAIERSIALDPSRAEAHHVHAVVLQALNRPTDAVDALVEALCRDPREEWRGELLSSLGDGVHEIWVIERVLDRLIAEGSERAAGLAVEVLARCFQLDRAISLAKELAAECARAPEVMEPWARALVLSGNYAAAAEIYLELARRDSAGKAGLQFLADFEYVADRDVEVHADWRPLTDDSYRQTCLAGVRGDGALGLPRSQTLDSIVAGSTVTIQTSGNNQIVVTRSGQAGQSVTLTIVDGVPVTDAPEVGFLRARLDHELGRRPGGQTLQDLWIEDSHWWKSFEILRAFGPELPDDDFAARARWLEMRMTSGTSEDHRASQHRQLAGLNELCRARGLEEFSATDR